MKLSEADLRAQTVTKAYRHLCELLDLVEPLNASYRKSFDIVTEELRRLENIEAHVITERTAIVNPNPRNGPPLPSGRPPHKPVG